MKTLLPGEHGTKKLMRKYGDKLICVRYRYERNQGKRLTTVEIIEDEKLLRPVKRKTPRNKIMHIKVAERERHLRQLVKKAGGRWNYKAQAWELPYGEVLELGLEKRLVKRES